MKIFRSVAIVFALALVWQIIVWISGAPVYILPGPLQVIDAWWARPELFLNHGAITAIEIIFGLILGFLLGGASALSMIYFKPLHQWLMPVLVISQAIPVFALAPVLVLWLGYGMASKIAMATMIIYFPVTAAFFDGLKRTDLGWVDLARTMNATPFSIIRHIRIPAALPALASGLRVAAAVAPIGAIVGEWVGSSEGLGYLMLYANARLQIDVLFAALLTLAVLAITLYFTIDKLAKAFIPWQKETLSPY